MQQPSITPGPRPGFARRRAAFIALGLAGALGGFAGPAAAHDTWFEPRPALRLALGTGNQFPKQETGVGEEYLVAQGCRSASAGTSALRRVADEPHALLLEPLRRPAAAGEAYSCWVQLTAFDIEIQNDIVEVYLAEVAATAEVRAAWADLKRRGLPWRERYTKHARIDMPGRDAQAQPVRMAADIVLEDSGALRAGQTIRARVLKDGAPLRGLPVELRHENAPLGIWRRTDADGRLEVPVPLPGRWLLRGTELRLAAGDPTRWESTFVTLAFEVGPKP